MASGLIATAAAGAISTAPPGTGAPVIQIENLRVRYKLANDEYKTILDGLSLNIAAGEFVVLLGQTGCGKSTLLRLLLGQEQPGGGTVKVSGAPVETVDSRSGYVPQKYSLFPHHTVLGNLMIGPEMSGYHLIRRLTPGFRRFQKSLREEALLQLRHMGLHESDAGKYPHQLSGGMQQRVAIAQALMMKPRILLMDEAFSALDPSTRSSLQKLLRSVWEESHPTIVFVTHNTAEALFLGTRVVVLARPSEGGNQQGAKVALDMQLPSQGVTLARDGKKFLDLVDHIERCSSVDSQDED